MVGGRLKSPESKFRKYGEEMVKDIGLDALELYPGVVSRENVNLNGDAVRSGLELSD